MTEHLPELTAWAERFGLPALLLIFFLWRIEPRLERLTTAVHELCTTLTYALADHAFTGIERRHQQNTARETTP